MLNLASDELSAIGLRTTRPWSIEHWHPCSTPGVHSGYDAGLGKPHQNPSSYSAICVSPSDSDNPCISVYSLRPSPSYRNGDKQLTSCREPSEIATYQASKFRRRTWITPPPPPPPPHPYRALVIYSSPNRKKPYFCNTVSQLWTLGVFPKK